MPRALRVGKLKMVTGQDAVGRVSIGRHRRGAARASRGTRDGPFHLASQSGAVLRCAAREGCSLTQEVDILSRSRVTQWVFRVILGDCAQSRRGLSESLLHLR